MSFGYLLLWCKQATWLWIQVHRCSTNLGGTNRREKEKPELLLSSRPPFNWMGVTTKAASNLQFQTWTWKSGNGGRQSQIWEATKIHDGNLTHVNHICRLDCTGCTWNHTLLLKHTMTISFLVWSPWLSIFPQNFICMLYDKFEGTDV